MVFRQLSNTISCDLRSRLVYEITNGVAKKYYSVVYPAGGGAGQTVAMRTCTTDCSLVTANWSLTYFLSDHLGSTSVVLDANGGILEQQRYLPFGGARTVSGSPLIASTDFTYTGQRNLPDTGLMDYKARFYSPSLGRFIQPDTIIPGMAKPQSLNRYSYVRNNPIRYNDPSGHSQECGLGELGCNAGRYTPPPDQRGSLDRVLASYGITTSGFERKEKWAILRGARDVGEKLSEVIGNGVSGNDAFRQAHGNISIEFNSSYTDYCKTDKHSISCGNVNPAWYVQAIIHEFGHVFDNQFMQVSSTDHFASDYPANGWDDNYAGYKCDNFPCIQHPQNDSYWGTRGRVEDFADMYLNWVVDMNPAYPNNGFTDVGMGNDRRDMMNNTSYDPNLDLYPRGMPVWLQLMGLRNYLKTLCEHIISVPTKDKR